jgi:phosphoribosyl-ATP pyrophosphohydrolase
MTKQELITKYFNAQREEEVKESIELMNEAIKKATPEDKETLKAVVYAKNEMLIKESKDLLSQIDSVLATPDYTINLNEWVTMKEYSKRFNLSTTNVVTNWIKRGIIPQENIRTVPMLNGLKLIKAVKYL